MQIMQCDIGKPGSSLPSDIFVHDHDPGRFSVFRRDLLTGQIPVRFSAFFPDYQSQWIM